MHVLLGRFLCAAPCRQSSTHEQHALVQLVACRLSCWTTRQRPCCVRSASPSTTCEPQRWRLWPGWTCCPGATRAVLQSLLVCMAPACDLYSLACALGGFKGNNLWVARWLQRMEQLVAHRLPLTPPSRPVLPCAAAPAACPATKRRLRPWRPCRCTHPWATPWACRQSPRSWRTAASRWVALLCVLGLR